MVEAFNRLGLPLKVVGDGPERKRLERLAGPTVEILGRQSSERVESLLGRCRAFVYARLEDFGIAPVEVMASGAPVIGLGRGGLLDGVRCAASGVSEPTGVLFPDQTAASVVEAVTWFEQRQLWRDLVPESLRLWAERFSSEAFVKRLENLVLPAWQNHIRVCDVEASDPACLLGLPRCD